VEGVNGRVENEDIVPNEKEEVEDEEEAVVVIGRVVEIEEDRDPNVKGVKVGRLIGVKVELVANVVVDDEDRVESEDGERGVVVLIGNVRG
jgi:hypothetical protein